MGDGLNSTPIDAVRPGTETTEFSLRELIREVVEPVLVQERIPRVTVVQFIDPAISDWLAGDCPRLKQVLSYVFAAAVRFSADGQIKLSVFSLDETQGELESALGLSFELSATGQDASISLIHGLGRHTAANDDTPEASADISLALPQRLVQLLGGEIGFQVDAARLATFWFRIAVQRVAAPPLPRTTTPGVAGKAQTVKSGGKEAQRILMAEDNCINQRVGKLILQRAGYSIDLVADGSEALEAHKNQPYDLILMDCQMPTMDGFEATRQIRSMAAQQPVIIAVTANALVGERERCLAAGMDDYLSKPFQAGQLVSMVEKWTYRRPSDDASGGSPLAFDEK